MNWTKKKTEPEQPAETRTGRTARGIDSFKEPPVFFPGIPFCFYTIR